MSGVAEIEQEMPGRRRSLRRLTVAVIVVLTTLGALCGPAGAAARSATTTDAEVELTQLINQERVARGLAPLATNVRLRSDARAWSGHMAARGVMEHVTHGSLGSQTAAAVPGWQGAGENVGKGWAVGPLHAAFMASTTHRANILGDFNHVGVGVVHTDSHTWVTVRFAKGPVVAGSLGVGIPDGDLWLADARGRVMAFGAASHLGDASALPLRAPIVGMVPTPGGGGYWLLGQDGGVFTYGDAAFFGSTGGMVLNQPVNGMAPTPTGQGYWLVASDGGIFSFGDAAFFGSMGGTPLNQPVTGMAATPSGRGYWLVASDGGIFTFGDAPFHGSAADGRLGASTAGISTSPTGNGYWIVGTNGTVAAFGDATFHGDLRGVVISAPITRIQTTADGNGYWLVGADGAVYPFGGAGSRVSAPVQGIAPIVAVAGR